jgi:hypothetical protein
MNACRNRRLCHSRLHRVCVQQVVLTAPTTVYLWHPSKTICPSHGRRCGNISACGLSSSSTRRGSYRLFPQGPPDRIRSTPEGRRISSGHRQSRGLWRCVNDVLTAGHNGLDTNGGDLSGNFMDLRSTPHNLDVTVSVWDQSTVRKRPQSTTVRVDVLSNTNICYTGTLGNVAILECFLENSFLEKSTVNRCITFITTRRHVLSTSTIYKTI